MAVKVDTRLKRLLDDADLGELFRNMGWDNPPPFYRSHDVKVPRASLTARAVADKRGITVWEVRCSGGLPDRLEQRRVVRELRRRCRDQLTIFVDDGGEQRWLWPEQRPSGVGYQVVDYEHRRGDAGHALLQRLEKASFSVDEEDDLTASVVLDRVRRSFNAAKVTKAFYRAFNRNRKVFVERIEGNLSEDDRSWYTSVLLNRLMFIYFIQQKGLLDGDRHYLRNRLAAVRERFGRDHFYAFFRKFLLPLFHQGLGSPPPVAYDDPYVGRIIGTVPYVNGGIFMPHPLEVDHFINIRDGAFEDLFSFFDEWRWHLDERPALDDDDGREINPDILGFIFEQYVNQKQQGAYYTKPDVTGYMAETAIIPAVVDRLVAVGLDDPCILLSNSGDEYIHNSILYGADKELPASGERPPSETPAPALELALESERWCDVTHRRSRVAVLRAKLADPGLVWSIDDAVTENLDMGTLVHDYLTQLVSVRECETAFEVVRSLTVCDPTVGSGAFLFAAIDVLEPMYTTLVDRAAEIEAGSGGTAWFLNEARRHRSERYWLLKAICLHNLFGVDLMPEAVEIAKLRLFLKLVAQISQTSDVEPLPDLDFNIKAGNLLVGLADSADADRITGSGLPFPAITKATVAARLAGDAYREFTSAQAAAGRDWQDEDARCRLASRFEEARRVVDPELHELYNTTSPFEEWKESHSPFHWFAEFPEVWRDGTGGFDVIIGNPPYISRGSWKSLGYRWRGYETQDCPDLYAPCVERASTLLNDQGRMAMIVMHSLCFHKGLKPLRDHLTRRFASVWTSSYARIPDGLFSGSARVRNSIVVASVTGDTGLRTTRCLRWPVARRDMLFPSLEYFKPPKEILLCRGEFQWPFIDEPAVAAAFAHMIERQAPLSKSASDGGSVLLGYKTTAQYMLGIYTEAPPTVNPFTGKRIMPRTKRSGWLQFSDDIQRNLALTMLAGRWGYLWWLMFGDEFDVTKGVLKAFPGGVGHWSGLVSGHPTVPVASSEIQIVSELLSLSEELQRQMPRHIAWKLNAGLNVGRYNMLPLRYLTDKADWLLAALWNVEDAYQAAGNLRDRTVFGNKE